MDSSWACDVGGRSLADCNTYVPRRPNAPILAEGLCALFAND